MWIADIGIVDTENTEKVQSIESPSPLLLKFVMFKNGCEYNDNLFWVL